MASTRFLLWLTLVLGLTILVVRVEAQSQYTYDQTALGNLKRQYPYLMTLWPGDVANCSWYGLTCLQGYDTEPDKIRVDKIFLTELPLNGPLSDDFFRFANLTQLHLAQSGLTGRLPDNVCTAPRLRYLWIQNNTLSGEIPACLMDNAQLRMLNFAYNYFTGPFPNITRLPVLESGQFGSNLFSGQLPQVPYDLKNMLSLSWANNSLTGPLPDISGMTSLSKVQIRGNCFCGPIPPSVWELLPQEEKNMNATLTSWQPCPANISTHCPNPKDSMIDGDGNLQKSTPVALISSLTAAVAVILIGVAVAVYIRRRRRRNGRLTDEDQPLIDSQGPLPHYFKVPPTLHNRYIVHHEILNGQDSLRREKNSVFKATLELPNQQPLVVVCKHTGSKEYENYMNLSNIAAPHILPLIAASQESEANGNGHEQDIGPGKMSRTDTPFIVTRYVSYAVGEKSKPSTLTKLIQRSAKQKLYIPLPTRKLLVLQFTRVVQTLFSNEKLHTDLKADNIVVEDPTSTMPHLWLVDFQDTRGTAEARAPELEAREAQVTVETEVYAFGRVVFQLLFFTFFPQIREVREGMYNRCGFYGSRLEQCFASAEQRPTPRQLLDFYNWIETISINEAALQRPLLPCDGLTGESSDV